MRKLVFRFPFFVFSKSYNTGFELSVGIRVIRSIRGCYISKEQSR